MSADLQELGDGLRKLLDRPEHPAGDTALEMFGVMADMRRDAPGEQHHDRFLRLCRLVDTAFNGDDLTDDKIAENPTTPQIIRYIVGAFRDYRQHAEGISTESNVRASLLADAMGISGGIRNQGKHQTKWTDELKAKCLAAGRFAYELAIQDERERSPEILTEVGLDAAHANALEAALAAAYKEARRRPDGIPMVPAQLGSHGTPKKPTLMKQNSAERAKTKLILIDLLAEHGYKNWKTPGRGER
jgi:hypothetical protein